MKKTIFLLAAMMAVISFKSFAQPSFGIQAGGNMGFAQTEYAGNDDVSNKARFGFLAGGVAEIPFGPVSFRPEINYIQKGFKNEGSDVLNGVTTTTKTKARLNYIEMPLNFVYNIDAGSGKVFLGLGPNIAYGVSGNFRVSGQPAQDVEFDNDESTTGQRYKRWDIGADAIAGYRCSMGLFVDLGFTLGLTDISTNRSRSNPYYFTQKNHGLNLKVGYLFGGNGMASKKTTTGSSSGTGTF